MAKKAIKKRKSKLSKVKLKKRIANPLEAQLKSRKSSLHHPKKGISPHIIGALGELFNQGNNQLPLKAYIMKMVDVIYEAIPYDVISVKFLHPKTYEVRYRYICDKNGDYIDPETIILEEKLSKRVVRKKEKMLLTDIHSKRNFDTFFAVPLMLHDEAVGVISILLESNVPFHPDLYAILDICSSHLSLMMNKIESTSNTNGNYFNIFRALIVSLEAKDKYTRGHSQRVANYALQVGKKLGCSKQELKILEQAAYLHDIGKMAIPDSILKKPGKLTREEYKEIQSHVIKGAHILRALDFSEEIVQITMGHHECFNGQGYPDRLKGEDIPLLARIINVVDAYDAMVTDRPYRKALTKEFAIGQLKQCADVQFCPKVVEAFLTLIV